MLPGPAREMHPMFEKTVVPRLQTQGIFPEIDCYLQVRTAGIGESALAEKIEHLFKGKEALVVGYCAHAGMVDVRLSSLDGEVLTEEALHHLADACRDAIGEDFGAGRPHACRSHFQGIEISQQNFGRGRGLYWGLDLFLLHRDCGYLQSFSRRCGLLPQRRQGSNARGPRKHACSTRSGERRGRYRHGDRSLREIRSRLRTERNGVRWSPGGTQVLPVGSIYLGYSSPVGVWAKKIQLRGDRASNRRRAATAALDWMRRKLRKYKLEEVFAASENDELNV